MLLYFTVSNFRSIRDEMTLSMSAGRFKSSSRQRSFETGYTQVPSALRTCAIYGANASGKSSLIKALDFFQDFVSGSFSEQTDPLFDRLTPYGYGSEYSALPTKFEAAFVSEGTLYTYGFAIQNRIVIEEWLHAKTREQRTREVFARLRDSEHTEWNLSSFFKSKRLANTWKNTTRSDALFLSTAIALNAVDLIPVHKWITHTLKVITSVDNLGANITSSSILDNPEAKQEVVAFLKAADPTIFDIVVKTKTLEDDALSMFSEEFRRTLMGNSQGLKGYDVSMVHANQSGDLTHVELSEESDGTQAMYRFAWPFLQSRKLDFVVVVDELNSSLHPLLLRRVVDQFSHPKEDNARAQLIFTTHDSSLLSADLLERDQIWFIENDGGEGSRLIPLLEYKPRRGEAIQRAYLHGRYGGIPLGRQRLISDAE